MDDDNVLYVRGNGNVKTTDNEDVWDDSALIKAYDKAVNLAKEEVAKRMGMDVANSHIKQKTQNNKPYKKWTVGAPCRAVYSEDGETYEAIISKTYENSGTCIVKFVGYGNTEKVELSSLLESEGLQSQIAQQKNALAAKLGEENAETQETNFATANSRKYNGEKMECDTEDTKPYKSQFMPGPSFTATLESMPPAPPLPPQLMAKISPPFADQRAG
ncbi:survival motor neuron isoform X2 [Halictus rubicundus]|uniref:survival motor neuron isoform X2 n=1 Tax=Halictus rubicundus TaxID=77578 RepID=UPI00403581C2